MKGAMKMKKKETEITIKAPNLQVAEFTLIGKSPYVQNTFSNKAREQIKETQTKGSTGKKDRKKEGKDFNQCYEDSKHISDDGWYGQPASGYRAALISACKLCGFAMTRAKLSLFIIPDGFDKNDGQPLVRIVKGEPHYSEHHVRLETGVCDIRARAMWDAGWEAVLRVRFDADQFTLQDVSNLLLRAGLQVGIGEGRHDSKKSFTGMGWGEFEIKGKEATDEPAN
jgi:hypothetical protein